MSEARTGSWQERDIEELRAREASYRDRLAHHAALAERLNSYSRALQRMLRSRPPSRAHLSSTMLEVAKLSSLALSIERTSIWLIDSFGKHLHCTIQLVNHLEQAGPLVTLDIAACPSYMAALSESHALAVEDVYADARTAELHDYLRQRNIGALLDIPIAIPGALLGVVCHEHVGSPRIWQREEIEFGANVGSLLALALETERRLTAEHAQHGTEAKYRHLVEALPVTVYSFDVHSGQLDYVSPRIYDLGGWTAERWLGAGVASWVERVHPEDRPAVQARFEPGAVRGFPEEITYRVLLPDGQQRWVRDTCSLVRDAHGHALALQGILADVTPQIESELERRELERRHRFLLDHADLLAVMLDAEGRVTFVNDYLCRATGYTRAELIGRNWFEVTTPPQERERFQADYCEGVAHASIEPRLQAPLRTAAGERRVVLWTNTLLRRTDGVVQGVSGIGVDMTQRLCLEAELQQQTKLDSLGRLAAGVAHDFNNLLTVMIQESDKLGAFLNTVALDRGADDVRGSQHALSAALRQAAELTHSLLVYGRQEPLSGDSVVVDELVNDSLRLVASIAGPELKTDASLQGKRARVRLERTQLVQVLLNLVGNAADATRGVGTQIHVSTHLELVDPAVAHRYGGALGGEYVVLTVADDGCGMDERTVARIFDPFFTTKASGRGTGLGLAMCHSIVNRAGGFIQVESQPRLGTRFRIFLPNIASGVRPSVPSRPPPSMSGVVEAGEGRAAEHVRILVVEDVTGIRNVLMTCLRQAGYRVFEAENVTNAAQIIAAQPIDVLITDGNLPDGSGLVLARSARTVQPQIKLILVSGSMEADPGFDAILLKPFDVAELMHAIEGVLAERDSASGGA